jgi:hypothetical protein
MNTMTMATSSRPATASARPRVLAAGLTLGALTAAVTMLARPLPAEDFDDLAAVTPVRDAVWTFGLVEGLGTAVAYLCAGLVACLLTGGRGAVWTTIGAVLTGLGGLLFGAGFFALGAVTWYASSPGAAAFFDYFQDNSAWVFGVQAAGFGLSSIGFILLAVGLWRSRSMPRWLVLATPVALVAMLLSGTGIVYDVLFAVFMVTLLAPAWFLARAPRREHAVASGE